MTPPRRQLATVVCVWTLLPSRALIFSLFVSLFVVACRARSDEPAPRPIQADAQVELCSAYPYEPRVTDAVVIDRGGNTGDVVTFQDRQYNIHHTDCLALGASEIVGIRWQVDDARTYVGIQLRGDAADKLAKRSTQRMSQLDAISVAGSIVSISLYENVLAETLWLGNGDREALRALFVKLTAEQPPNH